MTKIQKISRLARLCFQGLIVLLPLCVCYYWLTINTAYDYLGLYGIIDLDLDVAGLTQVPLSVTTRFLALGVSLTLCAILMQALTLLVRLFKNYERQDIFSYENAVLYTQLGRIIFYWVIGSFIYNAVLSVILSFNNSPGERVLELTFTGVDVMTLVLGVIVLVISWVMKEAYEISEEHRQTI
ncbi:MAG: DUF2975 domain-containing protein [Methylocystaceae bacterium]|nr:DUF2975 domain-containing protein [Methylocystaceae bacterium]